MNDIVDQYLFCIETGKGLSIYQLQNDIHMAMAEGKKVELELEVPVEQGERPDDQEPESKRPCLREDPATGEQGEKPVGEPGERPDGEQGERPDGELGERPDGEQEERPDEQQEEKLDEQQEGPTVAKSGGNFAKRRKVILLLSYCGQGYMGMQK